MKKILLIFGTFLVVFLIYYFNIDEKVYYLSLGDYLARGVNNFEKETGGYSEKLKEEYKDILENYVNYSSIDDYRVMDLINDINYNKTVMYNDKEYNIQNLLVKANLITISLGMNDLIYKRDLSYDYIDELLNDIESLLKLIRKYNKDEIYFLGFYNIINNSDMIDYTNKRLERICNENKIKYVDIKDLNYYIKKDIYPTDEGYNYIIDRILNFTK